MYRRGVGSGEWGVVVQSYAPPKTTPHSSLPLPTPHSPLVISIPPDRVSCPATRPAPSSRTSRILARQDRADPPSASRTSLSSAGVALSLCLWNPLSR